LKTPYSEIPSSLPDSAKALGLELPALAQLEAQILDDPTDRAPYGIEWWAPGPGTSRCILISDYLCACVESVKANMIEAALHGIEFLKWWEFEDRRLANCIKGQNGNPRIVYPAPVCPLDHLGNNLTRMHQAGVIRAIASSLDCLSGIVAGVAAVPVGIKTCDFRAVRTWLASVKGARPGRVKQRDLGARLEAAIAESGPGGWIEWTLDFRNMLVHRGRRTEHGQFVPREPVLLGPDAKPVFRAHHVTHLPRDPERSDVEVYLDTAWTYVLTEDSRLTLNGLLKSNERLIETVAAKLVELWQWRRENPNGLLQPREQWPQGRSARSTGFGGYAPGTIPVQPTSATISSVDARRMHAAALADSQRTQWATFD
jgi:hypothetical protein